MKQNIWEFVRREDGRYAVIHNGKLLADRTPKSSATKNFV